MGYFVDRSTQCATIQAMVAYTIIALVVVVIKQLIIFAVTISDQFLGLLWQEQSSFQ